MSTATVTLTKNPTAPLPAANAAFAKTTVTVTDSAGTVIPPQDLNGKETPPWTAVFTNVAAVAGATGTVTAQDFDVNGLAIGAPVTATFTEIGTPPVFPQTTAITVAIS
jgi:hypothetical protein